MKYAHAHHFWTWFQKYSNLLLALPAMNKKEREYWYREINTHLMACTKNLSFELLSSQRRESRLIITTYGKVRYFHLAEAFVAKAPRMPGWQVIALQPPGLLGELLLPFYGRSGIDLTNCWFLPPDHRCIDGRYELSVYAELYTAITTEMNMAVEALAYELLGEKTKGFHISWITIHNLLACTPEEKQRLLRMEQLPAWLHAQGPSAISLHAKGLLQPRK
ncbi:hypothetical protein HB364_29005 [Pseudoflavitalea sp. X16]|uniref:hypothetical protein n=1 Tax=Paraflavitalea devenefica TaxID=2716334 RepID=UPI0014242B26|nr:hypothetical protein [Paraflavitalea devenefica]NII29153.1 hypothetical protein [Paraflavitalea devenefica]